MFADWLDEHGEPERAEFTRTQIRWHHAADATEKQHLNDRAAELFRDHWQRWLRPFLLALDPHATTARWYESHDPGRVASLAAVGAIPHFGPPFPSTSPVSIARGFVSCLGVNLFRWVPRASLDEAYRHEPPHMMQVVLGGDGRDWARFTNPVLRRVQRLTLNGVSTAWAGVFDDPHFAGVRHLTLDQRVRSDGSDDPMPPSVVTLFARSPLAYRISGLELPSVFEDGVEALCRPGHLRLERLHLGGSLNTSAVRWVERGFADTVVELRMNAVALWDSGIALLARGAWRKLRQLEVKDNGLTAAVLPALAAAAFTPRLRVLDLSANPLFTDPSADLAGLQTLGEMLDPDTLERLDLSSTGLTAVPHFLAERFGDRVTVG